MKETPVDNPTEKEYKRLTEELESLKGSLAYIRNRKNNVISRSREKINWR